MHRSLFVYPLNAHTHDGYADDDHHDNFSYTFFCCVWPFLCNSNEYSFDCIELGFDFMPNALMRCEPHIYVLVCNRYIQIITIDCH